MLYVRKLIDVCRSNLMLMAIMLDRSSSLCQGRLLHAACRASCPCFCECSHCIIRCVSPRHGRRPLPSKRSPTSTPAAAQQPTGEWWRFGILCGRWDKYNAGYCLSYRTPIYYDRRGSTFIKSLCTVRALCRELREIVAELVCPWSSLRTAVRADGGKHKNGL